MHDNSKGVAKFSWETFRDELFVSRKELLEEKLFSDVTLVSDDLLPFEAHRSVLSSASPILKKLLLMNASTKPVLYMKGLKYQQLVSLLNFIYIGETVIGQDSVEEFIRIGKDFNIRSLINESVISKDTVEEFNKDNKVNSHVEDLTQEEDLEMFINSFGSTIEATEKDENGKFNKSNQDEIKTCNKTSLYKKTQEKKMKEPAKQKRFKCYSCAKTFPSIINAERHMKAEHGSVIYICDEAGCKKSFKYQESLFTHNKTYHNE